MAALLPLAEAQARLLALAEPLPIERIPVDEALGRCLAEPLVAKRTQPAGDVSAMDGYAMRAADLPGPWKVAGQSAAGHPYGGLVAPGEAIRISTGALMPAGSDMVLMQEDAGREGNRLTLIGTSPNPSDKHVRPCGNDFSQGRELLAAGSRLGPAQLALAIGAGHSHLAVRRKPRLVVIDSGDELAADPCVCAPHQVPASNGVMLAALASAAVPCNVERIGPVTDCLDALGAALARAEHCDVVVTSGGASVGDHDLIRPALASWGAAIDFWKVAIKPGKPVMIARRGHQLVVGLPGNPVSSHVTAYFFLLPLLRALLGAAQPLPEAIEVELAEPLSAGGPRLEFLRGRWDGTRVTSRLNQDSGAIATLAASNVLIERAPDAPSLAAGDRVRAYPIGNGGVF